MWPGIGLLLGGTGIHVQGGAAPPGPAPAPQTREQIWYAPTADDWAKPCLIPWQRTWEDALDVARQSGRPLMVCVNMDGEIASEHYAGVRYRQSEIAALFEPYVCVMASVYRHTERDFDAEGRRTICPRFGSVTCGEHIAIEPKLYQLFFDERRVAPRHVVVELDGRESSDVYYAFDTASVFRAIEAGAAGRDLPPRPSGDRPLEERMASRDQADRAAAEQAFLAADPAQKRALLELASRAGDRPQLGLLRLAMAGFDLELARMARATLAQIAPEGFSEEAVDLMAEALNVPLEASERAALLDALARWADRSPRARMLETVQRGLTGRASALALAEWRERLTFVQDAPREEYQRAAGLFSTLDQLERRARSNAADGSVQAALARSFVEAALDPSTPPRTAELLWADAERSALAARALGDESFDSRLAGAVLAARSQRHEEALALGLGLLNELPRAAEDACAVAVLEIVAGGRARAIRQAWRAREPWPSEWVGDLNAAYDLLASHPRGRSDHAAAHVDFLSWIGARQEAERALARGLERFPAAPALHERLRARVLYQQGALGLERAYAELLEAHPQWPDLCWFAGYAGLVVAEHQRRAGQGEGARAAYDRAIALFESAREQNPESSDSCSHYQAMALAGQARVALEAGQLDSAAELLLAALTRHPNAAASLDGLGFSAVSTGNTLLARLDERQANSAAAQRLLRALASLEPGLLEPPAFERDPRGGAPSPDAQRWSRPQR
jgi:tetratricopeptide (TPR) repeat protein